MVRALAGVMGSDVGGTEGSLRPTLRRRLGALPEGLKPVVEASELADAMSSAATSVRVKGGDTAFGGQR